MGKKAPGKSHREGLTLVQVMDMFPTEEADVAWFEDVIWPDGERHCGKCGSARTREVPNAKPIPYWCTDCRSYFSVRTGTPLARSNVPMRKWAIAIYLCLTSLKSVSSMKLARDIGVKQSTAWFMLHRIREAWGDDDDEEPLDGPVEVDETYIGGKQKNMSNAKRKELAGTGRGAVGKTAVIGMKDRDTNQVRAEVITETDGETLQDFVEENTEPDATVYTDEAKAYKGIDREHEAVKHSVSEYVRGQAHTNGMESFWSMLKRAHAGTFHKISPKHLDRYVGEFAGKHNIRDSDTIVQMRDTVARLVGRNLLYRDLIPCNGLRDLRPASRPHRRRARAPGDRGLPDGTVLVGVPRALAAPQQRALAEHVNAARVAAGPADTRAGDTRAADTRARDPAAALPSPGPPRARGSRVA